MNVSEANYPAVKANLEAIGMTGLPLPSDIVWTAPSPCTIAAQLTVKKNSVATSIVTIP